MYIYRPLSLSSMWRSESPSAKGWNVILYALHIHIVHSNSNEQTDNGSPTVVKESKFVYGYNML